MNSNSIGRVISKPTTTRHHLLLLLQSYSTKSKSRVVVGTTTKQQEQVEEEAVIWARPKEVPFESKIANLVTLIGNIHMPIHFVNSTNGNNSWAGTVITHQALWMPVLFEGDLAHTAASHLKLNDHVHITGQLVMPKDDAPCFQLNNTQPAVQVLARSLNFVHPSPDFLENSASFQQEQDTSKQSATVNKPMDSNLMFWKDLRDNPNHWVDYRTAKIDGLVNPKHPDFKHKEGNRALWVNTAPSWMTSELRELKFELVEISKESKLQNSAYVSKETKPHKREESWKDVLANPDNWWDNRVGKKNPKSPDFKHKNSGEALWLDTAPDWVKSKLPPLESKDTVRGYESQDVNWKLTWTMSAGTLRDVWMEIGTDNFAHAFFLDQLRNAISFVLLFVFELFVTVIFCCSSMESAAAMSSCVGRGLTFYFRKSKRSS
ncbi:hypothetical protein ACFE04_014969 [Oxalis oulophora]